MSRRFIMIPHLSKIRQAVLSSYGGTRENLHTCLNLISKIILLHCCSRFKISSNNVPNPKL